jgi:VWFA-related protein
MFDAVADAIPLAQQGTRRKKALVVISDGKDTSSRMRPDDVSHLIQESEVLVYAIGIDGSGAPSRPSAPAKVSASRSTPVPSPFPGRKVTPPPPPPAPTRVTPPRRPSTSSDRVNEDFLRAMTDHSGGRTEILYSIQDLDQATAGIAGELSQQYFLAYSSSAPRDGRWHTIEVRVKKGGYLVRARRGFIAS